jgi:PPOX class probable F420-dependent enzyme
MDDRARAFLEQQHAAAMITLRPDGTPHAVRVGVGLIDGKVWSSGTQTRVRTRHLRRDPRATLFVFDAGAGAQGWRWLALESTVTVLDGPDAPELNLRFMQQLQQSMTPQPGPGHVIWFGQERTIEEFLKIMVEEQRLIYQFEPIRTYGMY